MRTNNWRHRGKKPEADGLKPDYISKTLNMTYPNTPIWKGVRGQFARTGRILMYLVTTCRRKFWKTEGKRNHLLIVLLHHHHHYNVNSSFWDVFFQRELWFAPFGVCTAFLPAFFSPQVLLQDQTKPQGIMGAHSHICTQKETCNANQMKRSHVHSRDPCWCLWL